MDTANAYFSGDLTRSYAGLSARCRDLEPFDAYKSSVAAGKVSTARKMGVSSLDDAKSLRSESRNVVGSSGEVRVWIGSKTDPSKVLSSDPAFEHWTYEDGAWKAADCT